MGSLRRRCAFQGQDKAIAQRPERCIIPGILGVYAGFSTAMWSKAMQRLEIKNLGKLAHAEIRLGSLTVFAGPNNTGKSFVSKLLYSILNAMSTDPTQVRVQHWITPIRRSVRMLARDKHPSAHDLITMFSEMENVISPDSNESEWLDDAISLLPDQTAKLKDLSRNMQSVVAKEVSHEDERTSAHDAIRGFSKSLSDFDRELNNIEDPWDFIVSELEYSLKQNLVTNFQIPDISDLKADCKADLQVGLDGIFQAVISGDEVNLKVGQSSLRTLAGLSNVSYLESPIYWKLSTALEEIKRIPIFLPRRRQRQKLTAVPGYFYDLARELKFQSTGDIAFPEVYEWLVSDSVINGRISVSRSGDMSFEQKGRTFPLQTTATGVANLGILALLIERKIIDHDTVLFIDEPEAHLHPAWQVTTAEALFRLAKAGGKVVIATHSLDILKWLEVWVKKHPEDKKIVALNKFPVLNGDDDFDQKMAKIKADLTKPFFDLYLDGA